jgi:hypothetical protein
MSRVWELRLGHWKQRRIVDDDESVQPEGLAITWRESETSGIVDLGLRWHAVRDPRLSRVPEHLRTRRIEKRIFTPSSCALDAQSWLKKLCVISCPRFRASQAWAKRSYKIVMDHMSRQRPQMEIEDK